MTARPRMAAVIAACGLLAMPAAAQAATKTVDMGVPVKSQSKLPAQVDVNAFFPHTVAIRAGDTVRFRPAGFHNVDLPAKGGDPLPLIVPNGQTVTGVNDAAGNPFWFNGSPQVGFNPALGVSGFGKSFTYRGNKRVGSGLPLEQSPKPMRVKFPKKGKYTYFCDIHPGMEGQVVVKRKNAGIPTAKQDRRRVNKQFAGAVSRGKKLASVKPPANTAYLGSAAKGGVEYFGMVPGALTVPVGTTVTFAMSPRSYETHTATFGPGNPDDPTSYIGAIVASFQGPGPFDPRAIYPSEPGTTATYTSTLHGNGFWNSGALDRSPLTALPVSNTVTFGAAGSYTYICAIHPFMRGQVVVQ